MSRLIRINPRDNVAVALEPLKSGESALGVTLREDIPAGHKFALCDIAENENVVKYGFPIGHATQPIPAGSWVHTHNVKTNLSGLLEYSYHPHPCAMPVDRKATFEGYVREDGRVGIHVTTTCGVTGKTGIEMEALTAASVACLTVYDMCKAVDRGMEIMDVRLLKKDGGKTGLWEREA